MDRLSWMFSGFVMMTGRLGTSANISPKDGLRRLPVILILSLSAFLPCVVGGCSPRSGSGMEWSLTLTMTDQTTGFELGVSQASMPPRDGASPGPLESFAR